MSAPPAPLDTLTPPLRLTPGAPAGHNLHSRRQDWVPLLARRVPLEQLPRLWSTVFNLCGHAHTAAAMLALRAAGATGTHMHPDLAEWLRQETWLEHTRRIHLDWPRLLDTLPGPDGSLATAALQTMQAAPMRALREGASTPSPDFWPAVVHWQEQHLLHMPASTWLAHWQSSPRSWLQDWVQSADSWLARLLQPCIAADRDLAGQVPALPIPPAAQGAAGMASMQAFAQQLLLEPGLSREPLWQDSPAHTGSWSRSNQAGQPVPAPSTLTLLGSRLAEWLRLAQPAGATQLAHGSHAWDTGRAVAWVEMARGVLVHVAELAPAGAGQALQVQQYRIVAPTEWNFHPLGAVAHALAALPSLPPAPAAGERLPVHLLMAAFDPCVPFEWAAPTPDKDTTEAQSAVEGGPACMK